MRQETPCYKAIHSKNLVMFLQRVEKNSQEAYGVRVEAEDTREGDVVKWRKVLTAVTAMVTSMKSCS